MDDITTTIETTSMKRDRGGRFVIGSTWQTRHKPPNGAPSNMQVQINCGLS
jgi:hypothetical protein